MLQCFKSFDCPLYLFDVLLFFQLHHIDAVAFVGQRIRPRTRVGPAFELFSFFCSFPGFCSILGNGSSTAFCSIPCLSLLVPVCWLSLSVVPDNISIMLGRCSFSKSNASLGVLIVSFFFCFRTGSSPSLVLVDSDTIARLLLVFLNFAF